MTDNVMVTISGASGVLFGPEPVPKHEPLNDLKRLLTTREVTAAPRGVTLTHGEYVFSDDDCLARCNCDEVELMAVFSALVLSDSQRTRCFRSLRARDYKGSDKGQRGLKQRWPEAAWADTHLMLTATGASEHFTGEVCTVDLNLVHPSLWLDTDFRSAVIKRRVVSKPDRKRRQWDKDEILVSLMLEELLSVVPPMLKSDPVFLKEVLDRHSLVWSGRNFKFLNSFMQSIDASLKKDRSFMIHMIGIDGRLLQHAADALRNDEQLVKTAVEKTWRALSIVPDAFKENKPFVLECVRREGGALQYVGGALRSDEEVVRAAMESRDSFFEYAGDAAKEQKELVLSLVGRDGRLLEHVGAKLKQDREVVEVAVNENANAFIFAHTDLRKDRAFVLRLVKSNAWALVYADSALHCDKDLVEAIQENDLVRPYIERSRCSAL